MLLTKQETVDINRSDLQFALSKDYPAKRNQNMYIRKIKSTI